MAARFSKTKVPERASGQVDITLLPGETRPARSLSQFSPDNPDANIPRIGKTPPNEGQLSEVEIDTGTSRNTKPTGGKSNPPVASKPESTNISQPLNSGSLNRKPVPLKSRKDINIIEKLAEGFKIDPKDKGTLYTRAGRSLQKKGREKNNSFPAIKGDIQDINKQGQEVLESILNNPGTTVKDLGRGGLEFRASNGWGVRYNKDGRFCCFVQP